MGKNTARHAMEQAVYLTDLIGLDGKKRRTTHAGKLAERYFMDRAKAVQTRVSADELLRREEEIDAFKDRLEDSRARIAAQEADRNALHRRKVAEQKTQRDIAREESDGVVMLRIYEDLGPVWTHQWLNDYLVPDVPEIADCRINVALTCKALLWGLEAYKERRRQRKVVRDAAAFIVQVASDWQKSKPTLRVPLEQALKTPERIAPSR